jgi:putative N6-adenine-specific DNA methylase
MSPKSSLTKRIKRHVIGRVRTYFAATAPGFEELCLEEIKALGVPPENAAAVPGGIEFQGRLVDCYQANLQLRTASRILMRIDQFKATNFQQIETKAARIPWELYLPAGSPPRIKVSTHHCRIYHSDAISERILNSIPTARLQVVPNAFSAGDVNQTLYIRGLSDRFTVSIDSSGTHLHKRGLKQHPGRAPLRETAAAAALMLAGYRGQMPLVDPMCGTGTFSLEAAMIAKHLPPGGFRQFAFMGWPSFRRRQWEYLKRRTQGESAGPVPPVFASDKDSVACRYLKKCLVRHPALNLINISQRDFFDIVPERITDRAGLIAINPPYGRRLESGPNSQALFQKICSRLKRNFRNWQLILVSPNRRLAQKVPLNLSLYPISHGGLRPVMMIGTIP